MWFLLSRSTTLGSLAQGKMYGCTQSKVNKTAQEEEEERNKLG